jgi:hypothetical protein
MYFSKNSYRPMFVSSKAALIQILFTNYYLLQGYGKFKQNSTA